MLNGDDLGIWFETSNDIIRVYAVKNLIFRAFLPCSSFELARRANSEYLSFSVIFGFYKKWQKMTKPDIYSESARRACSKLEILMSFMKEMP